MRIRVGHLYPDYLNIYADRGNIAVLSVRAQARGHDLDVRAIGMGDAVPVGEIDLFYVGGGQDREQELVAHDLAAKSGSLREAVDDGAAFLAVCGGYQLLGSFYRDVAGGELDCAWAGETLAGFENHAGRTILGTGAEPLGQVVSGFGNDGASGFEGCRYKRAYGTYLHGPLLPRNPWFADRLLEEALAHAGLEERFEPLADELEREAHAVSAARARSRGGKS
jgi:CobQ-like glutamine amidotransferase family enzyme